MYNLSSEKKIFDIKERTFRFGVEIVRLVSTLPRNSAGYAISNQVVRSGTSIGANVIEGQNCGTKKEFIYTLTISLKEARETEYWLKIINEVKLADQNLVNRLLMEVSELIKILTTIIKKSKLNS
jgi:four helix bundle protein